MNIKDCLEQGFLRKIAVDKKLIEKELKESAYDLESAKKALSENDYKWCIIKSYYSMFHAAKSVMFKLGYIEKRHFAVNVVLEDLNKKGKLESKYISYFSAALSSREEADYHYNYSKEIATHNIMMAEEFLGIMKILL